MRGCGLWNRGIVENTKKEYAPQNYCARKFARSTRTNYHTDDDDSHHFATFFLQRFITRLL